MKFTKRELQRIREALSLAVSWEASLIDCYCGEYDKRIKHKMPRKCRLPHDPHDRNFVARTNRNIKAFKKISEKIKTHYYTGTPLTPFKERKVGDGREGN